MFIGFQVQYVLSTFRSQTGTPLNPQDTFYLSTANVMTYFIYGVTFDHDDPELHAIRDAIIDWYVN